MRILSIDDPKTNFHQALAAVDAGPRTALLTECLVLSYLQPPDVPEQGGKDVGQRPPVNEVSRGDGERAQHPEGAVDHEQVVGGEEDPQRLPRQVDQGQQLVP